MPVVGIVAIIVGLAVATLVFSALTYSLRLLNRIRLADYLDRHGKSEWLDRTMDHVEDMALVTAVWRMVLNTVLVHLVGMLGTQVFWGSNPRAPIGG